MTKPLIINLVSFQFLWFACVQAENALALSALFFHLIAHQLFVIKDKSDWLLVIIFCVLGLVLESVIASFGFIHFSRSYDLTLYHQDIRIAPLWLLCLWAGFATTLQHSLSWLRKSKLLTATLVAIFIPISYYAGANFSKSDFPLSVSLGLLAETIIWLAVFPLGFALATFFQNKITTVNAHAPISQP